MPKPQTPRQSREPEWVAPFLAALRADPRVRQAARSAKVALSTAYSRRRVDPAFARDVVALALDHAHDNEVARAYDRGERFTQRVELFNWWGEQLTAAQHEQK